jgi:hypothetical protein
MGGKGDLWKDERNPQPELLEDHGGEEFMRVDDRAWDGEISQPEP